MEEIKTFFDILGYVSTIIVILSAIVIFILWALGIAPVLIRLGNGLSRRKIAIFAKGDALSSLKSLLHDSKLFQRSNLIEITTHDDIGKSEEATLFLVHWIDWKDRVKEILDHKMDGIAVIVYAPQEHGFIPPEDMKLLNSKRNVIVTNFRGRLLNDLVTSMITTSYEK